MGRSRVDYFPTVDFSETVTTRSQLREVLAEPSEFVTNKEFVELDEFGRDFIARSPIHSSTVILVVWLMRSQTNRTSLTSIE